MKKLVVLAAIIVLTAGIAYAKEFVKKGQAGTFQVEFKIDNLRVGANDINIEVKDESGKSVSDAKVQVKYSMPEGIDLPPMHFETGMKLEGNEYKGKIKIPMAGTWTTVVNVIRGGKTGSMKFNLEVH